MAYSRPWAEVYALLGTRDADEIDDNERENKSDLDERLADILHGGPTADPWVLKVPGVSVSGTQNYMLSSVQGQVFGDIGMDVSSARVAQPLAISNSGTWVCGLPIPRGSKITAATFRVARITAGASAICRIIKVDEDAVRTTVASEAAPVDASGLQDVEISGLTEEITTTAVYYLEVFLQSDGTTVNSAQLLSVNLAIIVAGYNG